MLFYNLSTHDWLSSNEQEHYYIIRNSFVTNPPSLSQL